MSNIEKALCIENLTYSYKNKEKPAVLNFSLQVEKGSFTTLLGPSGCGKTTLLRCISGFLNPTEGSIYINGVNQNDVEPNKRKIGMVFQDYALFPHLSVEANIMYGLKVNNTYVDSNGKIIKYSKRQLQEKVHDVTEILDLQDYLSRYPHELSGGQQQRVALARAIVLNPEVLLMDEPLSSLDTKLREKVRDELKEIQHKLGITTIYVTHDQEEALSLSDTIAIINNGTLQQIGSPRDVYYKPANAFVADFVGRANFLQLQGQSYMVRPEWLTEVTIDNDSKTDKIQGTVISSAFLGDKTRFRIQTEKGIIIADLPTLQSNHLDEGRSVSLQISHKWKL
ncbi:MAG: ABC transporter ATP-binding protein [Spirochaetia bacterium]|nr:ABC transporter ATP-binding protein [Spirochaetia bacterium]MDD7768435.1 ABC transporter ATP-binding protein [Treponema sp.]